jgi:hypothetical protein
MTNFMRFLFSLLLVQSCSSFAQITLDTHNKQDNGANSQSSAVVRLKNVSAGDLITCEVSMDSHVTFSSVSDASNGTYVAACPVHTNTAITQQEGIFYFPNAAAGTYSVTLETNGSWNWSAISCQAWKGAASSSPLDTTIGSSGCLQQDQTNTPNPTAGAAVAPSHGGALVIASALMGNSNAITAGADYTMTDPDTMTLVFPEYWVQPVSTATNGNYTAPSNTWTDQMVAFKPEGSGVGNYSVSLSWTPSTSSDVTSYSIYRMASSDSTAPPPPYPLLVSNLPSNTVCSASSNSCAYTDSTVVAATSYWYYAMAVSGSVDSAPSNTAQAIVP